MKKILVLILVMLALASIPAVNASAEQAVASASLVIFIPERNPQTQLVATTEEDKTAQEEQKTTEGNITLAKADTGD